MPAVSDPTATVTEIDGRRLRLTHLDRVLYPQTGWTKAAALRYYALVAPWLLPHLAGRPASFLRFPAGVDGQRFWAKNVPGGAPDWLTTLDVTHREGELRQVVVADLPTLLWAANLGALELHVPQWQHTPAEHDRLIIDLDPGPGTTLVDCCAVALLARRELRADGLTAWPKTSGGKGLHLLVPLRPAPERVATDYARQLAARLRAAHPELVVDRMDKSLRTGRVFVDWSQNSSAKTTAAPYSLRAGPRPGVSAPLTWTEVAACRSPDDLAYTPERVAARESDPMAGLTDPANLGEL
ncbi:non-homologous end-joining DNA ligase [Kitasatospora sp. MAP5-34]|uniref:non-homologous end-joining DNA ligase n=1 Tax=Kitasatospora sp. MAP5-34 TaxID=3035102 RepID=UPI002476E6D8|nr:non-homologous end-joining DNA ligase [Kitasatospora sp. MAP5-34]MDH6576139.1 bifunctional non-homologous end joining protein LigD [Kitasatospora sp. MAP5-34]